LTLRIVFIRGGAAGAGIAGRGIRGSPATQGPAKEKAAPPRLGAEKEEDMFREERAAGRPIAKFWLGLGALALGFLLVVQAEAARGKLTPEEYVRQQAVKGEWADLSILGEKDEDRTLSACFLEELLTGAYKVHRKGVMITNAVIAEPLDLELAHVPHTVWLYHCRFQDVLNCRDAVFEQHLNISVSHFEKKADFQRLKVKLNFFCRDAIFQGPVDFTAGNIDGQFSASGAQFQGQGKDNKANFNGLNVGNTAYFVQAIFQGPVDFTAANIEGQFSATGAKFQGQGIDNLANFNGLKVGGDAFFDEATFQGPVDFGYAIIDGGISAVGAKFLSKDKQVNKANFNGLKVGMDAFFDQAIFQGPVDFTAANIEGALCATGARFQGKGKDNEAKFNSLKVGQTAFFENATFMGPVDLRAIDIGLGFQAIGAKFSEHPVSFLGMKVKQFAILSFAEFHGPVDFSFCTIQALEIPGITLPTQKDGINLEGLIYKSITAGDNPEDWKKLLALVDQARYHAQPYSQLETFLKESGYPERANEVFIAKKRREMKETWHWWDYLIWPFEKVLLDWGVGYGRHPQRAFGLSLLCIILGTLIFYRPGVLSRKEKEPEKKIKLSQAFWFSFDAFLPFIKLGPDKLYKVDRDRRLSLSRFLPQLSAQTYFYLHQLAGYILVTIGIAAVTGIIK
jgi:uncharacterized protein YjbI with pentapeptide repeats